jgi:hypothetical protein
MALYVSSSLMNSPFFVCLNVNVLTVDSKRAMNGNPSGSVVVVMVLVMVIIEKSQMGVCSL